MLAQWMSERYLSGKAVSWVGHCDGMVPSVSSGQSGSSRKSWRFCDLWWCPGGYSKKAWHPTPVLLPGESRGWRSLVGCSPWGREESDTTEWLSFHFSLSCVGEGNGNPLQCSCLENPRDGGAWWAAVYGVTQSRTRLKWLSSRRRILGFSPPTRIQARLLRQSLWRLQAASRRRRKWALGGRWGAAGRFTEYSLITRVSFPGPPPHMIGGGLGRERTLDSARLGFKS